MTTIVGNDDIFGSMIQLKPYVFNSCFLQSLLYHIFFETYGTMADKKIYLKLNSIENETQI
jgi:hypothetical protein